MNLRRLSLFTLVLAIASPASAEIYARATVLFNRPGAVHVDNASRFGAALENHQAFGVAIGYTFSFVRLEAEWQHLRADVEPNAIGGTLLAGHTEDTGVVKEDDGFANVYLDLPRFLRLRPYVGAGLGYARASVDRLGRTRNGVPVFHFSGRDTVFGYQGMAGLQLSLGRAIASSGYRVVSRGDMAVRDVPLDARRTLALGNNRMFEVGLTVGF